MNGTGNATQQDWWLKLIELDLINFVSESDPPRVAFNQASKAWVGFVDCGSSSLKAR
jgi:hypothetical protein